MRKMIPRLGLGRIENQYFLHYQEISTRHKGNLGQNHYEWMMRIPFRIRPITNLPCTRILELCRESKKIDTDKNIKQGFYPLKRAPSYPFLGSQKGADKPSGLEGWNLITSWRAQVFLKSNQRRLRKL